MADLEQGKLPTRLICCDDPAAPQPDTDDCVSQWQRKLADTTNELANAQAQYGSSKAEHTSAVAWEQRLKTYWEAVGQTERLVTDVLQETELFIDFARQACTYSGYVVEAAQLLTCDIWQAYRCNHLLKEAIARLVNDIKCLSDAKLTPTSPVMKCLADLEKKVDEAETALTKAITEVLKLLYAVVELSTALCADCRPEDADCRPDEECCRKGLIANLLQLQALLESGPAPDVPALTMPCDSTGGCDELLPLSANPYHSRTETQYGDAQTRSETLRVQVSDTHKTMDALASTKKGLENAIKAALDAQKC